MCVYMNDIYVYIHMYIWSTFVHVNILLDVYTVCIAFEYICKKSLFCNLCTSQHFYECVMHTWVMLFSRSLKISFFVLFCINISMNVYMHICVIPFQCTCTCIHVYINMHVYTYMEGDSIKSEHTSCRMQAFTHIYACMHACIQYWNMTDVVQYTCMLVHT